MTVKILVVSNDGSESLIDFYPVNNLIKVMKSLRTPENRMVCILQNGERLHRWDRNYGSVQKNHWRKVAPDSFEILGSTEHIRHVSANK